MRGTIIKIYSDKDLCDIHVAEGANTYKAPLVEFKDHGDLRVGADCEFEIVKDPSLLGRGEAKLLSCTALNLANEKVALSYNAAVPEHNTQQQQNEYLIAAEGRFERECRSALIEKAIECKANALLNLHLECVQRPGVKPVLFRYTATPAQVTGPKYNPEPGVRLNIPTNLARRNSPNEAKVRYVRVLLLSFLFIAVPCIISLTKQAVIPSDLIGQMLTAGLIMACMGAFLFITSTKRQSYILNVRPWRKG